MSKEYPCIHNENGLCKKFSTDGVTSYCVEGPCEDQQLSNADRIRAMSDEELAKWILDGVSSDPCDYCGHTNEEFCDGSPCRGAQDKDVIIAWLQQPAEEVHHE